MFQSAPALSSGRYEFLDVPMPRPISFNPRPPFRAGDTDPGVTPGRAAMVSIRARPFERAIHVRPCGRARPTCFNPRPPFRAGDTGDDLFASDNLMVSIRARPFERAIRWPRPRTSMSRKFQSAPALSSGRYPRWRFEATRSTRFNPRPPFRAGDTVYAPFFSAAILVSIRARPFERAIRRAPSHWRSTRPFQSAPALSSGRYAPLLRNARVPRRFNPRPPFRAGDTRGFLGSGRRVTFQSAPALSSGRYPTSMFSGTRHECFNPRPPFRAGDTK